jgi:uncharacterized membrane protein YdjX (TVP38/TMEM64 family)
MSQVRGLIIRRSLLVIVLTAIAGAMLMVALPAGRTILGDWVTWLRDAGALGKLVAMALVVFGIPFGLPVIWLAALIGYLYGMGGLGISLPASLVGATLAFLLSRWLLAEDIKAMVAKRPKWRALADAVEYGGWRLVALLRLWAPHNILNLVLGASRVPTRAFVGGTAIGFLPTLGLATVGGALAPNAQELWRALEQLGPWSIVLVGVGVAGFIGAIWWVKLRVKRELDRIQAQTREAQAVAERR